MPKWETEEGAVDINEYNLSLLKEPERDKLRESVTSQTMRERVLSYGNGHRPVK